MLTSIRKQFEIFKTIIIFNHIYMMNSFFRHKKSVPLLATIAISLLFSLSSISCSSLKYYPSPSQDYGGNYQYYSSGFKMFKCYKCGKETTLYKVDSKDRIICPKCYMEIINE